MNEHTHPQGHHAAVAALPDLDLTPRPVPYEMRGDFLEVCDCFTICPCWTGRDPDEGACTGVFAWAIGEGEIDGTDVSGRTVVSVATHTGHRDNAHEDVALFIDDGADDETAQKLALVFSGLGGGALGDLGRLVGHIDAVERRRIEVEFVGRRGRLTVYSVLEAETEALTGPDGADIELVNARLSSVLGSPAKVGVARRFRVGMPGRSLDFDLRGRSAMLGAFEYRHAPEAGVKK